MKKFAKQLTLNFSFGLPLLALVDLYYGKPISWAANVICVVIASALVEGTLMIWKVRQESKQV